MQEPVNLDPKSSLGFGFENGFRFQIFAHIGFLKFPTLGRQALSGRKETKK